MSNHDLVSTARNKATEVAEQITDIVEEIKPRLRGVSHQIMAPISFIAGVFLIIAAEQTSGRIAASIFVVCAVLQFAASATLHRRKWKGTGINIARRLDHAAIYLLIAGTYTPIAVSYLPSSSAATMLAVVWTGAMMGVIMRVFWTSAPRILAVSTYVGLGWVSVLWADQFGQNINPAGLWLIVSGGVLYTIGAMAYAFKRPNPSPVWFGFHEVFHAFTVLAFASHFAAVAIAVS